MELKEYLSDALHAFERDPADTDFQRGYLDALIEVGRVLHAVDERLVAKIMPQTYLKEEG